MSLPAVLHPDVVDFLRKYQENTLKDSVWNCLQKLRLQQFDGGLRVKKLKGISKRVWEARLDRAARLVFTYEKSMRPETGEAQVYIAVQDICVDHDDVCRQARARKRTPDAQWLDAELVEAIGSLECDRSALDPDEQFTLYYAQTASEEIEISQDLRDELLGNTQWRVLETESEWQRSLLMPDIDLSLKLTPEEYELVYLPGNLLLEGTAGTGKTTVALYRLLQTLEHSSNRQRLYVACSPLLVKTSQEQFKRLVGDRPEMDSFFQFKTLRDLCLQILEASGNSYSIEDEVNFQIFSDLYRRQQQSKQFPPALVWSEIRSIVKGYKLDIISETDYENLGRSCPTVIPASQRSTVYKLAEWYEKKLKKERRFDEIDLTRQAIKSIAKNGHYGYQLIVCDEVQDLTGLQFELLQQLIAPDGYLFFAGDVHQMINPGGFRWEDLKQKFYQKRAVVQRSLTFNFRSVGTLVNLANQLLKLRARLLDDTRKKISETSTSYGELARVVAAPPEALQLKLGKLNPGDAILVRTQTDKERFSRDFQSTLVFTVEESKGLEFDTVFLVEFFQHRPGLWSKVLRTSFYLEEIEKPELKLELNLLYIAVTRARRVLNIWEASPCEVWSQSEVVGCVDKVNVEVVVSDRTELGADSWRDRGLYYMKAEFYRQAEECFQKAGDIKLQWEAGAKLFLQERNYGEAARVYVKLEKWEQAAKQFEKANQWEEAANCWGLAGNTHQQQICKIYKFEAAGQYAEAAEGAEALGQFETAARHFEKLKQWQQAAKCWAIAGNTAQQQICEIYVLEADEKWEKAAKQWEALRRYAPAKRCWLNSDNELKKAEYQAKDLEKNKKWSEAAEYYERAKLPKKAAKCREKELEMRKQQAQAFEKKKEWLSAAEQYELAGLRAEGEQMHSKILPEEQSAAKGKSSKRTHSSDSAKDPVKKGIEKAPSKDRIQNKSKPA